MLKRSRVVSKPNGPVEYPVGSFVKTEAGYFYISSNTKRMRFISKRVLDSWNPPRVILTSETALSKYRVVSKMKFRSGSLIHNLGDGKIYLISENKRRQITNPDVLTQIGGTLKDVISVSTEEINLHEIGDELK